MILLGTYKNGNYTTSIYSDGTKVRMTEAESFISAFPENIDIKITNQCDRNCPMCHERSTTCGNHGDILNADFIDTLHPYTELAIGGGNPLAHPDLIPFLIKLQANKIIANITVNQTHFIQCQSFIRYLVDAELIHGIGVSLVNADKQFIETIKQYPNAVVHVINGIFNEEDYLALRNNGLKMLILGYKNFGRGTNYLYSYNLAIENNQSWLYDNLETMLKEFNVVSFDNLAIEQLDVKRLMSEEEWESFYMGNDGNFTMYIDMVNRKFARCSIADDRYDLLDNIEDMFKIVKTECN